MDKKVITKKKEGDFSLFSNLSAKASASSQTVSKKKLIRGILHAARLGYRAQLGNPVQTLDANIALLIKYNQKHAVTS